MSSWMSSASPSPPQSLPRPREPSWISWQKTFLLCFEDTAVQARTRQKNTNRSAKSRISDEPTSAHLPPPKVKSSSFKPWQYEDSDSDNDLVIMHRGPAQGLKPTSPEGINVEFEIDSKGIIV
jgi:hypothetical protein